MKLLQIALSLLLVLSPIACASLQTTTQDAVSNTNYGVEFHEAQKALDAQGDAVLRWAERGSNYFVVRYSVKKTFDLHYAVFKDDIFTAFIKNGDFNEALAKYIIPPVGKLPFEDGFEPLYSELLSQKSKSPHVEVNEAAFYGKGLAAIILISVMTLGGDPDFLFPTGSSIPEHEENLNILSIGTSKGTVIKLLGQPESSHKSIESDYEILSYRYGVVIGLRTGNIEWIFHDHSVNQFYFYYHFNQT
jgi:hypothetical protein